MGNQTHCTSNRVVKKELESRKTFVKSRQDFTNDLKLDIDTSFPQVYNSIDLLVLEHRNNSIIHKRDHFVLPIVLWQHSNKVSSAST